MDNCINSMDVQVNRVDIRELQLPDNVKIVNVLLSCALVVYIISTVWGMWRRKNSVSMPLLHGETEL